ncbi:MAG: aminotransferase class V-fold PLP-dependent enzyme [Acidimicrobiales bacterium]
MGAALDYALALGIDDVAARVQALAARLRDELAARPGVTVHDGGSQRCGIVTFTVAGRSADEVVAALGAGGVNGSVSAPAWARLDLAAPVVRLSPHYYNTELELERAVELAVGA